MRLDHLLFKKKEYECLCTHKVNFLLVHLSFPIPSKNGTIFEITKEGTEKLSVMLNLFQHLCDNFLKEKRTDGECEKKEA